MDTLLAVVGPVVVDQQIPLSKMADPPSFVTLPPLIADDDVILDIAVVVTIGALGGVANCACGAHP